MASGKLHPAEMHSFKDVLQNTEIPAHRVDCGAIHNSERCPSVGG